MASRLQRLDPERRRRRLALLAELADAKAVRTRILLSGRALRRGRVITGKAASARLRELIALRKHLAG